jgi:hypothetical protein
MKRSSYRLSKILKNESLVGFSSSEINELLLQRALLKKQPRKSINNNAFLSQFGRANGFEQARLIKNHKTFNNALYVIKTVDEIYVEKFILSRIYSTLTYIITNKKLNDLFYELKDMHKFDADYFVKISKLNRGERKKEISISFKKLLEEKNAKN